MGLLHSKPLATAFNSLNSFFNLETECSPIPKTFHLLRLPLLALIEVLKSSDPIELFILSLCSRKVANCIHVVGTKKWKLSVDVGNKYITINDSYGIAIIETSMKPSWTYDRGLKLLFIEYQHSGDSKLELQKVLSQLFNAFKCPVTSFEYNDRWKSDQCWVSALKCIIQNQVQPLELLDFHSFSKTENLEWALRNVKVTRKICIWIANFQPIRERNTFLSSRFLSPDLMMLKSCKCIELDFSWLTVSALNVFIKEWKAGSFPNLQYMLIGSYDLNWHWYDHILGFDRYEMQQLGVRRKSVIDKKQSIECTGGVDIQADNGTKATMQMDRTRVNWFELFVWND